MKDRILDLVVEKTGYPKDMLDLDLDLEADLGVDTVKQAEMFASIREMYNIPARRESQAARLSDSGARDPFRVRPAARPGGATFRWQTSNRSAGAVGRDADSGAAGLTRTIGNHARPPALSDDQEKVLEIVAEKTGYPKDMLDLDLDLEADLGIDTVKQAEMFASVRASLQHPARSDLKLRDFPTLAHVIKFAQDRARTGDAAAPRRPTELDKKSPASPPSRRRRTRALLWPAWTRQTRIPRRVPVPDASAAALTLCKPTGVALDRGRRVVIMR